LTITFDSVLARWPWRPIANCPGRWVLCGTEGDLTPEAVLGEPATPIELHSATTPDTIFVVHFERGGLLTFQKANGVYVHTLNTPEGLARRLQRLAPVEG
jgi:hypothetical protein